MKKLLFLLLIPFYGISQEVVKRNELYQIPEKEILSQFVIEHKGLDAKSAYSAVRNWAASAFVNTKEVTVSERDNFIVYKPLLKFSYKGLMGVITEGKITAHTKFEFKDDRSRVTITELPSTYISQYGSNSFILWPSTYNGKDMPNEYPNKGGSSNKFQFRKYTAAIVEKNSWVKSVKNIDFNKSDNSGDDDW